MFGRRDSENPLQARISAVSARRERPAPAPSQPAEAPTKARLAETTVEAARALVQPAVDAAIDPAALLGKTRVELARIVEDVIKRTLEQHNLALPPAQYRDLVTTVINGVSETPQVQAQANKAAVEAVARVSTISAASRASIDEAIPKIYPLVMERIDTEVAAKLKREELARQLGGVVAEVLTEQRIQLNQTEQRDLVTVLLNDMLGFGPLEPLLADDSVNDIMVNGPKQVYVERKGKLEITDVTFRDNAHVMSIATRIVTMIGRRVDESTPLVDARLPDGSRVNIIVPPLAIDGPSISIRKFSKKGITLDVMMRQDNISPQMAVVLKIAARSRLNILISGGTGSGKTTLLNAMSQMIDSGERIVTIEDAAELQLQQPHVVRLETRPPNLEGRGEITMRDLVKNSLRMRPDRIILGEIRGAEALDVLQAMNTGHDGSLSTVHANRPREALTRLENMIGMAGVNLPSRAIRTQIAAAVDMIVQVSRMRDGIRRVTNVTEVIGMEGDVITTQELFSYRFEGEHTDGRLKGRYDSSGLRPHFTPRAEYFGLDRALLEAMA
ncbi:MAG TPA: ATPase, T2SS/T4P/T4SS family [Stellaceae bacterium]|nr:ATPase, T2SS/T4P/T4SS family [Stellaceae bacterium]